MRLANYSKYGLYDCYNCLCEVCTRRYCPYCRRRAKYDFCVCMIYDELCPIRKCDFFEHKEIHLVWRVKRIGKRKKSVVIIDKLDEILEKLEHI